MSPLNDKLILGEDDTYKSKSTNVEREGVSHKHRHRHTQGERACFYVPITTIDLGDFVQVIDNTTQKVVIQGLVTYRKDGTRGKRFTDENRLFSVDDKHFFKLGDNAYTVKKLGNSYSDDNFISENYKEIS